jgi:hypothetical protein
MGAIRARDVQKVIPSAPQRRFRAYEFAGHWVAQRPRPKMWESLHGFRRQLEIGTRPNGCDHRVSDQASLP